MYLEVAALWLPPLSSQTKADLMCAPILQRGVVLLAAVTCLLCGPTRAVAQETRDVANPYAGQAEATAEGRSLFNVHCAHCHGPNAVQGERVRDLRRLNRRYGNDFAAVFFKTAMGGREEKGMPSWAGAISPDSLWKIFTFIEIVQDRK